MAKLCNTPAMDDEDSALSAILDELGGDALDSLRQHLGGFDVKLPKCGDKLADDHPVVQALGREDAGRLCELMRGASFYMPHAIAMDQKSKLGAVAVALKVGRKHVEIARDLNISARHVRRLKAQIVRESRPTPAKQARQAILTGA